MPIFTAKNYEGKVESVVLAKSPELAQAYWQGQGIHCNTMTERKESDLDGHPTGVLPIVNTRKVMLSSFGSSAQEYLVIDKG